MHNCAINFQGYTGKGRCYTIKKDHQGETDESTRRGRLVKTLPSRCNGTLTVRKASGSDVLAILEREIA